LDVAAAIEEGGSRRQISGRASFLPGMVR